MLYHEAISRPLVPVFLSAAFHALLTASYFGTTCHGKSHLPMKKKLLQVAKLAVSALVKHNKTSTETNDDRVERPPDTRCTAIHGRPLLGLVYTAVLCTVPSPSLCQLRSGERVLELVSPRKRTSNNLGHCTITTPAMEPHSIVNWPIRNSQALTTAELTALNMNTPGLSGYKILLVQLEQASQHQVYWAALATLSHCQIVSHCSPGTYQV